MFDRLTPVVKNLLIANIGIFFMTVINKGVGDWIIQTFAMYQPIILGYESLISPLFKPWQAFSYMFLHANTMHLFSNMFGLFIFGSALESYMGSKKFLYYYLLTGIGAALINSGVHVVQMTQANDVAEFVKSMAGIPMVGASGAIFGILVAFGVLFPNTELMLLFFPVPIKAKYFVILYGLYELYAGTNGSASNIAHFAHIGGLITGYILLKFFRYDQRSWR